MSYSIEFNIHGEKEQLSPKEAARARRRAQPMNEKNLNLETLEVILPLRKLLDKLKQLNSPLAQAYREKLILNEADLGDVLHEARRLIDDLVSIRTRRKNDVRDYKSLQKNKAKKDNFSFAILKRSFNILNQAEHNIDAAWTLPMEKIQQIRNFTQDALAIIKKLKAEPKLKNTEFKLRLPSLQTLLLMLSTLLGALFLDTAVSHAGEVNDDDNPLNEQGVSQQTVRTLDQVITSLEKIAEQAEQIVSSIAGLLMYVAEDMNIEGETGADATAEAASQINTVELTDDNIAEMPTFYPSLDAENGLSDRGLERYTNGRLSAVLDASGNFIISDREVDGTKVIAVELSADGENVRAGFMNEEEFKAFAAQFGTVESGNPELDAEMERLMNEPATLTYLVATSELSPIYTIQDAPSVSSNDIARMRDLNPDTFYFINHRNGVPVSQDGWIQVAFLDDDGVMRYGWVRDALVTEDTTFAEFEMPNINRYQFVVSEGLLQSIVASELSDETAINQGTTLTYNSSFLIELMNDYIEMNPSAADETFVSAIVNAQNMLMGREGSIIILEDQGAVERATARTNLVIIASRIYDADGNDTGLYSVSFAFENATRPETDEDEDGIPDSDDWTAQELIIMAATENGPKPTFIAIGEGQRYQVGRLDNNSLRELDARYPLADRANAANRNVVVVGTDEFNEAGEYVRTRVSSVTFADGASFEFVSDGSATEPEVTLVETPEGAATPSTVRIVLAEDVFFSIRTDGVSVLTFASKASSDGAAEEGGSSDEANDDEDDDTVEDGLELNVMYSPAELQTRLPEAVWNRINTRMTELGNISFVGVMVTMESFGEVNGLVPSVNMNGRNVFISGTFPELIRSVDASRENAPFTDVGAQNLGTEAAIHLENGEAFLLILPVEPDGSDEVFNGQLDDLENQANQRDGEPVSYRDTISALVSGRGQDIAVPDAPNGEPVVYVSMMIFNLPNN